jgi:hypothetical protein
VLFAWVMLGELPSGGLQLIGGALIMVGIALVRIDEMHPWNGFGCGLQRVSRRRG